MPKIGVGRFALCLACLAAPSCLRSQPIPVAHEFQVNSHTPSTQWFPAVGLDDDGDFVVAWSSYGQDGSGFGVFARRFNAAGVAQAGEFQVNSYTPNTQGHPAVALDSDGDFVIAWASLLQDLFGYGIFARRFDSAGVAQATEFHVSEGDPFSQQYPVVALDGDGDFVVAWETYRVDGTAWGVFARRFDSAGVAQGGVFRANVYDSYSQRHPSVALDLDGDLVVTWMSNGQDAAYDVLARRFDSAGVAQADEFQVSAHTAGAQTFPAVGSDGVGDFVVAWQEYNQDGSLYGVFARRFDAAGEAQAGEFQVNAVTAGSQDRPVISLDDDGDFVVAWQSPQDGGGGIFARRFNAAGEAQAGEFQVNIFTVGAQYRPAISLDHDGDFVVAWQSFQDGSDTDVFAQRFAKLAVLDIDGNGATGALTDGLLVLRYLFGFTGATLVAGAVDAVGCSRCTAGAIEGYLQTLI